MSHQSIDSVKSLKDQIAALSKDLERRKQSIPRTDPAYWNTVQSFAMFYDLRKALNGEPCALYFTTATSDDVFDLFYATSTVSGCSVSGVMNLGNPDLDRDITENAVPGIVVVHRDRNDTVAAKFAEKMALLVRTRESYMLPPSEHHLAPIPTATNSNMSVHIIWLQFGGNMKWNTQH